MNNSYNHKWKKDQMAPRFGDSWLKWGVRGDNLAAQWHPKKSGVDSA